MKVSTFCSTALILLVIILTSLFAKLSCKPGMHYVEIYEKVSHKTEIKVKYANNKEA